MQKDRTFFILIVLFVLLFTWQINLFPGERFPGWDHFWHDVLTAGRAATMGHAVKQLEIPAIDPYTNFGFNHGGDLYSPWNPVFVFLSSFTPPRAVVWYSQMFYMAMGGIGAYLLLKHVTSDRFVSLLGALCLLTIPYTISLHQYCTWQWMHYPVPLLLYMIHRVMEEKSRKWLLGFVLISAMSLGGLEGSKGLFVYPVAILTYAFIVAWRYYGFGFFIALKKSLLLFFLCLLAGSIYILPLWLKCRTIADTRDILRAAAPGAIWARGAWQISAFGPFFKAFSNLGYWQTLYTPFEGAGYLAYIPGVFYLAIIGGVVFLKPIFGENRKRLAVVVGLVAVGVMMIAEARLYWSPLSKLFPSLREATSSIIACGGQINLVPFVNLLAAFICFATMRTSPHKKLKVAFYLVIVMISLIVDYGLIVNGPLAPCQRPFDGSNRIEIQIANTLHLFPWISILPVVLLAGYDFWGPSAGEEAARPRSATVFVALAFLVPLINITIHNQWLEQSYYRLLTRSSYRWDSYVHRRDSVDALIDRSDPDYRTLYCGAAIKSSGDGRDWKAIAETELHVSERYKTLFSYREYTHPYTGLMYGLCGGGGFQVHSLMPPVTDRISKNLGLFKGLMGIKHVISINGKLENPNLIFKGECHTPDGPEGVYPSDKLNAELSAKMARYTEGGPTYVYEVRNPAKVAFLVDDYEKVGVTDSWKIIYEGEKQPWNDNIVYLETDPPDIGADAGAPVAESSSVHPDVTIVKESYRLTEMAVSAAKQKFLVLTYLHRPFWRATVDGERVPLYRAYGGFMCVQVPAGEHLLRFRYYPWDGYLGALLSAVAFVLAIAIKNVF